MLQEELVNLGIDWVTNYYPYENPEPVNIDRLERMLIKHVKAGSTIGIFPDSDIDGFFSALIMKSLVELLGCKNVVVLKVERKMHGITSKMVDLAVSKNIDLLITVDSSTNNRNTIMKLASYGVDHIIIDHHIITEDIYSYPKSVAICNCKEKGNEKFSKVSAAMLCYIITHNLLSKVKIDKVQRNIFLNKMYVLGYITLYTDSMDLADEYNLSVVRNVEPVKSFMPKIVSVFMSKYDDLNRNFIEYKFAPRINSVIRRERFNLLYELLFKSNSKERYEQLLTIVEDTYADSKAFVDKATEYAEVEVGNGYVITNLDQFEVAEDFRNVMKNYTGLIANQLSSRYRKLAIVLCTDSIENFKGSVRDPYSRKSLLLFNRLCECGGHMSAFGIKVQKRDYKSFCRKLELSSDKLRKDISVAQIVIDGEMFDDRLIYQVRSIAEYNEVSGNTLPKAIIRKRLGHMQKISRKEKYCKIMWEGMEIVCFASVHMGDTIDITPTLSKTGITCYGAITVNE